MVKLHQTMTGAGRAKDADTRLAKWIQENPGELAVQIYQGETEPEATAQRARHFVNLFEAPTLFYAACLAAMVTGQAGSTTVVLAWCYVAARFVHSYIHLGGNVLQARIGAYFTSWAVLIVLWTWLVVGVATAH